MSRTPEALIDATLLVWARESIGLSLDDAAAKLKLPSERLAAWETGESRPSIAQLRKLAGIYKRPLAVFFLPEPPRGFQALRDFRRLPTRAAGHWSPDLHAAIRRAHFQRDASLELYRLLGEEPPKRAELDAPPADRDAYAMAIRDQLDIDLDEQLSWRDPHRALASWIRALEESGVLVLQAQHVTLAEMRGFSISNTELPVIMLNGADAPRARIFTALHEYAHVLLNDSGVCDLHDRGSSDDLELVCNEIAAAVLLPRGPFLAERVLSSRPLKGRWAENQLVALAEAYSVSREVVLRRLLTFGLTTWDFVNEKRDEYQAAYAAAHERTSRGGPSPYVLKIRDLGRPYVELALEVFDRNEITAADVSGYLEVKINNLPKLEDQLRRSSPAEA
jgi:Zn-dependent peptidase ImmA (M78 family)